MCVCVCMYIYVRNNKYNTHEATAEVSLSKANTQAKDVDDGSQS